MASMKDAINAMREHYSAGLDRQMRPFRCLYCRRLVTDQTKTCPGCGATEFKDVEQEALETGEPVRVITDLYCKAPGYTAIIKLPE